MRFSSFGLLATLLPALHVLADRDTPDLGITMDNPNGVPNHRGNVVPTIFSTKLTFHKVKDAWKEYFHEDEGLISSLARYGWWQMNKVWVKDDVDVNLRPTVMTALIVGNEVYMSSSMKGGKFIYASTAEDNPIRVALNLCQVAMEEIWGELDGGVHPGTSKTPFTHRMAANCGEPMALYMYFQDHPEAAEQYKANPTPEGSPIKGARIVTVRNTKVQSMTEGRKKRPTEAAKTTLPYDEIVRFDPCATDEVAKEKPYELGCAQLTAQFGLKVTNELADHHDGFNDKLNLPTDKEEMSIKHIPIRC